MDETTQSERTQTIVRTTHEANESSNPTEGTKTTTTVHTKTRTERTTALSLYRTTTTIRTFTEITETIVTTKDPPPTYSETEE
jgi:hypothetical protein